MRVVLARYAAARVTNAAVVVIDNRTGSVIGWVGSSDFGDARRLGQIDGVLIRRQSASTLKPFLYALAIQRGWSAATLLPDAPLEFAAPDEPDVFRPVDFDRRVRGVVRLRTALASSLNVPAVYTLSRIGVEDFLDLLSRLGFTIPSDARDRYGLGAAIGNAEVSLVELAHAFTLFPRGGTLPGLRVAADQPVTSQRVFDAFSAWLVTSILSDPSARVTGFGTHTFFNPPFPALFKSGTSSEFTNLWCVGATPRFTVAVWAGNFDGRAVINKTGSVVPAQITLDVLTRLTTAPEDFPKPAGIVQARICTVSGGSATDLCPSTRVEYFRNAAAVPSPCTYHGSENPGEGLLRQSLLLPGESARIIFPVAGQVFYRDSSLGPDGQSIPIAIAARNQNGLSLTLDGRPLSSGPVPLDLSVPAAPGLHTLELGWTGGSDRVSFAVR